MLLFLFDNKENIVTFFGICLLSGIEVKLYIIIYLRYFTVLTIIIINYFL